MLDNKGFRDDLAQGGSDPQNEPGEVVTDSTLIPGYRAEDKPTTDSLEEQELDFEAILADIRKEAEKRDQSAACVPQTEPADGPDADEAAADTPVSDAPPGDEADEKQLMQNVLAAVRELTEEVKQLRSQIGGRSCDAADGENAVMPDAQSGQKKPEKKNKVLSAVSSVLFYVVIVAMVLGAFLMRSTSRGEPFMIAGYSAANVLTSSMEDVYPKGSLIITKRVDAKDLKVGDDITFMMSEESSITHRIIGITENYQGTGDRAFETKGTMNKNPDKEMVAAANVVGKVIFHSKALGDFANFVKANWPILIFALIVIIALISFLKWNAKRSDEEEKDQSEDASSPKEKTNRKRRLRKSEEEIE